MGTPGLVDRGDRVSGIYHDNDTGPGKQMQATPGLTTEVYHVSTGQTLSQRRKAHRTSISFPRKASTVPYMSATKVATAPRHIKGSTLAVFDEDAEASSASCSGNFTPLLFLLLLVALVNIVALRSMIFDPLFGEPELESYWGIWFGVNLDDFAPLVIAGFTGVVV